jgi:hypothetical protein
MSLDAKIIHRLHKTLAVVNEHGTEGPRLLDNAKRLWFRVQRFIGMSLIPSPGLDLSALELACFALQLPQRRQRILPSGRPARATLRERSEEAAELLIGVASHDASEELLDRTVRVLHEMPERSPMLEESKLLADAVNLEDFGLTGLLDLAMQTGQHGEGIIQFANGLEKRDQYGYWDSRLKDGFHFEPIRQLARKRLESARKAAEMLRREMEDDKL